mgnify:CR=1 FL=1
MVLRSSYTQSVFSVYSIYTEDIIERYLIKSVNVSGGRAGKAGTSWEGWDEWDRWEDWEDWEGWES